MRSSELTDGLLLSMVSVAVAPTPREPPATLGRRGAHSEVQHQMCCDM